MCILFLFSLQSSTTFTKFFIEVVYMFNHHMEVWNVAFYRGGTSDWLFMYSVQYFIMSKKLAPTFQHFSELEILGANTCILLVDIASTIVFK